ncbi:dihydrofolate reductase family protein [Nonomuraea sp. NPDC049141]|uniref:dihydrofolate reductase family protein n=1 Tax=Nonomuraea sp. NPDC049141 TaxID=3155500 RepID=UPI00340B1220
MFSRTYAGDEWTSRVIKDNLAEEVSALKARPEGGDLLLTGGAALAASLTELGLIDEYHIAVHPVVLGGGRRLFAAPEQRHKLRLVDSHVLDGLVVVSHYQLASK